MPDWILAERRLEHGDGKLSVRKKVTDCCRHDPRVCESRAYDFGVANPPEGHQWRAFYWESVEHSQIIPSLHSLMLMIHEERFRDGIRLKQAKGSVAKISFSSVPIS
jgi:hypothetical protein